MTDRERTEKTYCKIKTKYPQISNKDEIDNLAIKHDKKNNLLKGLVCLACAIICGIIFFSLVDNEGYEQTKYLFLIMAGSGLFECFRTFGKYSKIEQLYRPVTNVKFEGALTKDKIMQDCGKALKKVDYDFKIEILPLYDKEDETEIGIDNDTHHEYYFHFLISEDQNKITYKVKRDKYLDAVIGVKYIVVLTPFNEVVAAYQATNWNIDNELIAYIVDYQPQNEQSQDAIDNSGSYSIYKPNAIQIEAEPVKVKKLLPILSIVLIIISNFMPIIIGIPLGFVSVVLSIVGIVNQRTKLSISALIINVVLFLLLVVLVILTYIGGA